MLVPSRSSVDADGVIAVDVYIGPVADLRTFQVTLNLVGADSGSVVIESIAMDAQRGDFVFNGLDTVWTTGAGNGVMLTTLWSGGVTVTNTAYLGTCVLRASADAAGTFSLQVALDSSTLLRTSQSEVIAVDATPVIIPITDAE